MDTKTINRGQPAGPSLPLTLLLRTPAFPVNAELPSALESLKELIRTASPAFFEQIRSLTAEDLPMLKSSKIRYTLWKYFNRAKYRPVPFNGFAAVSLPDNPRAGCGRTQVEHKLTLHQFADWNVRSGQGQLLAAALLKSQLIGNPTLYAAGTEYRYTRFDGGLFSLAMAGQIDELSAVLDYCVARRPATAVLCFLQQHTGWRRTVALNFLLELTRHQLLWTDRHAGIIAETKPLCTDDVQASRHAANYIIAERKINGGHPEPDQRLLAEVARFLAIHFPAPPDESLQNFSHAFTRRYELQAVPLTQVMDPQFGIGYGEAVRSARESRPPSAAAEASGRETGRSLPLTPLIMALLSRFASDREIDLAGLLTDQAGPAPLLPNTLPVIYRPFGERMVLDHMGGCTTNALLGRFSLCGPAYHHRCREIAAWEASANPGADFFDISYHAEGHADNINRRMPAYPLELPINSWPAGDSLRLEDLLVTVRNAEIILLSAQSGRRLVPRMATAYNFKRSPLSVFRFLGDLQYQGLNVPMLPDLTQLFPGQPHYSRLSYRSVILFPETWMVPGGLVTGTPEDAARISHWLQRQNIDSRFRAGRGDQTLVFNPGVKEDIDMFVSYCRHPHHAPVYIAEALMDPTGRVHDEDGNLYAAQFIASVSHSAEVYPPADSAGQSLLTGVERQFPPGREWLCFEIYGHPSVTTDILRQELKPILSDVKRELKQWFFIRYEDQGPHLRLRLHLRQGRLAESVVQRITSALDRLIQTGEVRDIKIVTYRRELERYGTDNIALVETFFHADSVWVLQLLKRKLTGQQWYPYVLDMMREMIALAYPAGGEQRAFTKMMADVFAREFSWTAADFKRFNAIPLKTTYTNQRGLPARLRRAWLALERKNLSEAQKAKLLADLLHLHINRLFDDDQRMHEGVLYQLLFTHMKKRFRSPANVTERSAEP